MSRQQWKDPVTSGQALAAFGVVLLPGLAGLAIGTGHGIEAVAILVVSVFVVVGLFNWRRSVYGLLVYLPFSGIPILASYPRTAVAVLAKDVLFVIPAYLGFLVSRLTDQYRPAPRRGVTVLLAFLAVLVIAQALNPLLPNRLVAAIGLKVWLFYIPMWVLGYHLVRNCADLNRVLTIMSIAAVVPVLVGLIEAAAIYSGRAQLVYHWYGDAASSATQDFAELAFEGPVALRRVPSTFSFVAQYFAFTVGMVAITYAWWRGVLRRAPWSLVGMGLWVLVMLAGLLSGSRAAFFFIPFLMVLILLIERSATRLPLGRLLAVSAVIPMAVAVLGGNLKGLLIHVMHLAGEHFANIFVHGLGHGFRLTLFGLGTGIDTNASRYALSHEGEFSVLDGVWYESWFVKALLELGIAGLLLVVMTFSILVVNTLRSTRSLRNPDLRVISASLLALLVWHIVYCMKGQYLDMDPTNVYFWLFAGMLTAIPHLDRAATYEEGD
jgi:hypothetical protein